jgi:hypothetical protein
MLENTFRPQIKKQKNPELEKLISKAFEDKGGAVWTKNKLLDLLNTEKFNKEEFNKIVNQWNTDVNKPENFKGQSSEIESINCKNGKLRVYYFNETYSIKFGFTLNQD